MAEAETQQPRRGPGRPSKREKAEGLAGTIEQGLRGVAELLERRDELDEADSFAEILSRDARRQAEWLAALADNHAGAERVLQMIFGAGSIIGAAGAFGPLVSRLIDKIRISGLLDWTLGEPEAEPPATPFVPAEPA